MVGAVFTAMQRSLVLHPEVLGAAWFISAFAVFYCASTIWATVALLCLASFHPALSPSHSVSVWYADLVCSYWSEVGMRNLQWTKSPKCFLLKNIKLAGLPRHAKLAQYILSWALLVQSLQQKKTLYLVAELPAICNAPVVRIWFQLMGFVDYRTMSLAQIKSKDCFVLMFDAELADAHFTQQYIEDCNVIKSSSSDSTPTVQDP